MISADIPEEKLYAAYAPPDDFECIVEGAPSPVPQSPAAQAKRGPGRPAKKIKDAATAVTYAQQVGAQLRAKYTQATVEEVKPGKLWFMDMLEDAIENWELLSERGIGHLGKSNWEILEAMMPCFPKDVQACLRNHMDAWCAIGYTTSNGRKRGIRLIPGGPQAVRDEAMAYAAEHPNAKKEKKRKATRWSVLSFSLRTQRELYAEQGWTEEELQLLDAADEGDIFGLGELLYANTVDCLDDAGDTRNGVTDFCGILHDRDIWTFDDYMKSDGDASMKPGLKKYIHSHWVVRLAKGISIPTLAKALKIPANLIEAGKSAEYSFDNLMAYQIHAKYAEKTQYRPEEVVTFAGLSYVEIWKERHHQWERDRDAVFYKRQHPSVAHLRRLVSEDVLTIEDIRRMTPDEYGNYTQHNEWYYVYTSSAAVKRDIDMLLQEANLSRQQATAQALLDHKFAKTQVYIEGKPRQGKTQLARALVKGFCECFPAPRTHEHEHHWRLSELASRNAFDQLVGNEVMLINEARSETFPEYPTFLTVFDNYDTAPTAGRNFNRPKQAHRVAVATSVIPFLNLIYFMKIKAKGSGREDSIDQAIARFNWFVTVLPPKEYGYYNLRVARAEECEPYTVEIETGAGEYGIEEVAEVELSYRIVPFDGFLSPDGFIDLVVRDVDARGNGGRLAASGEIFSVVRRFQQIYREQVAGAVAAGKLADPGALPVFALPAPAGGDGDGED